MNQEMMTSRPNAKTKIIKRYQNRKLYDTQQTLDERVASAANAATAAKELERGISNDLPDLPNSNRALGN